MNELVLPIRAGGAVSYWSTKRALLILGLVAGAGTAVLAATGNPGNMALCIACFLRDSAGALKFHTTATVAYLRPEIVGILLGALLAAVASREYRAVAGSSPMIRFLLGGVMMIGALVFLGCPTRMVLRMSAGDLSAYVGLVGLAAGVLTGTLMLKRGFSLGRSYATRREVGLVLPILAGVALLASVTTSLLVVSEKGPGSLSAPVAASLLVGVLFGAIAHRTRMCFGGSLRDIYLFRDATLAMPIIGFFLAMLLFNVVTGRFAWVAFGPIAHAETLWNILGLYVVGFAAVLLGGCPLRQLVLAGSGSSDAAITVLGMFFGAAFAHNFGLASAPAAAATGGAAAVAGGPAAAGQVAVLFAVAAMGVRGRAATATTKTEGQTQPAPVE